MNCAPFGPSTACLICRHTSAYPGGWGVGVLSPMGPYFSSIATRIALSDFPSARIAITSRVMSWQMSQSAP
jgi:hypothetical protein